jgi:hypothetical protein
MHAQARAFIVHRTPTRIRIKIPNRRRQQAYFASLERVLVQDPDVVRVHSNPLTAGVIIECRKGFELSAQHHRFLGLDVEPDGILPARTWSRYGGHEGMNALSPSTFTLAAIALKVIVAIASRQPAIQLLECLLDALVQAAKDGTQKRGALRAAPSQ